MYLRVHRWIVGMTAISCAVTPSMHAAELANQSELSRPMRAVDVVMTATGQVRGTVTDAQGRPMAGRLVEFRATNGRPWRVISDKDGDFLISGLSGGVYQVVTGDSVKICRLWVAGTAPPSANSAMLVVGDSAAVRGQPGRKKIGGSQQGLGNGLFGGAVTRGFSSPWVVGGILAAGLAVPVAIANDRDDAS